MGTGSSAVTYHVFGQIEAGGVAWESIFLVRG